jgi:ABC-type molybdate transport system substrate-binding protein
VRDVVRAACAATALLAACAALPARAQTPPVTVYASASLRGVLADEARAFAAQTGIAVDLSYGPGGKLGERIAAGGSVDAFMPGDVADARRAHDEGTYGPVTIPVRTQLCLLVTAALAGRAVADVLLDPAVRVVTGVAVPPHTDPAGDYAEQLFAKIDRLRPGSLARLDAKALRYPGPALNVPAGADVQPYLLLTSNQADASVLYCAALGALTAAYPGRLVALALPPELAVSADFGLTVRTGAPPAAERFRDFLLSDAGQAIFERAGFTRVR